MRPESMAHRCVFAHIGEPLQFCRVQRRRPVMLREHRRRQCRNSCFDLVEGFRDQLQVISETRNQVKTNVFRSFV